MLNLERQLKNRTIQSMRESVSSSIRYIVVMGFENENSIPHRRLATSPSNKPLAPLDQIWYHFLLKEKP